MLRRNRNWVVLWRDGGQESNLWRQITAIYAPTRKAAINMAIQGDDNPFRGGVFRAVTAKAWGKQVTKP